VTNLLGYLRAEQDDAQISVSEWAQMFTYQGMQYMLGLDTSYPREGQERIAPGFSGFVNQAYKRNGVVFATSAVRMLLFSEARFQYRRPGRDLFGTPDLQPLEEPWPNATTRHLLSRMEQDVTCAGNSFGVLRPGKGHKYVRRLRPDWTVILAGSNAEDPEQAYNDPDVQVLGYAYYPGGMYKGADPLLYTVEEVAHYAPYPDPEANFRGMSWLQPIVEEVMADKAATSHKLKFFEHAATPNLVVVADYRAKNEQVEKIKEAIKQKHEGLAHAYKTLVLGGGADAKIVGANMKEIEFKVTQGAGETRIAAAAGVPPVIVGLSEGLDAATYSNYSQARRRLADGTMRPLWGAAAGALGSIIPAPAGAELWYDDTGISFLKEDLLDAAEIQGKQVTQITELVTAGYTPQSAIAAVMAGDLRRLEHSGMYSVQLHPPGEVAPNAEQPSPNGSKPEAVPTSAEAT
jgi:portal protein